MWTPCGTWRGRFADLGLQASGRGRRAAVALVVPGTGPRGRRAWHRALPLGVHRAPPARPGDAQALAAPLVDLHRRPALPAQGRARAGPVCPHLGRHPDRLVAWFPNAVSVHTPVHASCLNTAATPGFGRSSPPSRWQHDQPSKGFWSRPPRSGRRLTPHSVPARRPADAQLPANGVGGWGARRSHPAANVPGDPVTCPDVTRSGTGRASGSHWITVIHRPTGPLGDPRRARAAP